MNRILTWALGLGSALLISGCGDSGERATGQDNPSDSAVGRADSGGRFQPNQVVAIGRVEPEARIVTLGTDASGIIKRIAADAGDTVRKGQLILELDRSQQAAQLTLNRAQLQTQIRNIATAEAALKSARITAQSNQVKLDRTRNVVERGADTQQALDDAQTQYQTSVEAVQQQQASLAAARSQVAEARSQISLNEVQLTKRYVRAPADGVLLTMDVREGAQLSPGTGIGDFAPKSPTTALCEVDELFANDVRVGQSARIRQQGSDRELARGTVIYAAPSLKKKSLFSDDAGNLEDRRVREVRIRITSGQPLLYNSRVECVIATN